MLEFIILLTAIFISPRTINMLFISNASVSWTRVAYQYVGLVLATSIHAAIVWTGISAFFEEGTPNHVLWSWAIVLFLLILAADNIRTFLGSKGNIYATKQAPQRALTSGFLIEFLSPVGLFYYLVMFPSYAGKTFNIENYLLYFIVQLAIVAVIFAFFYSVDAFCAEACVGANQATLPSASRGCRLCRFCADWHFKPQLTPHLWVAYLSTRSKLFEFKLL